MVPLCRNALDRKIFVKFFSETVKSTKLKRDTRMDNWLLCCGYQNQAAAAYLYPLQKQRCGAIVRSSDSSSRTSPFI